MKSPLVENAVDKSLARKNDKAKEKVAAPKKSTRVLGPRKFSNIFKWASRNANANEAMRVDTSESSEACPLLTPSPRRSPRIAAYNNLDSLSPLLNCNLFPESNKGFDASLRLNDKGQVIKPRDVVESYMRSLKPFPPDEKNRGNKIVVRTGIKDLSLMSEELNSKVRITHSSSTYDSLDCCGTSSKSITKSCSASEILSWKRDQSKPLFKKKVPSSTLLGQTIQLKDSSESGRKRRASKQDDHELLICEVDDQDNDENLEECNVRDGCKGKGSKKVNTVFARKVFGNLFENKN